MWIQRLINKTKSIVKKVLLVSDFSSDTPAPTRMKCDWSIEERAKGAMDIYEQKHGYRFDIDHPTLFTEKIVWYKVFYEKEDLVRLVDKYLFKEYIAEKLGDGWTIPLMGVWDNIDSLERDWATLPEEFCLKSTLQSDGFFIKFIHEKSKISFGDIKPELSKWLKAENTLINSYCRAFYKATPRIIAEKYETEVNDQLYDYKFFCFDGKPIYVYVAANHFNNPNYPITFYDLKWNKLNVQYGNHLNDDFERPNRLEEMIQVARKLSEGFPFIRVDFFNTKDHLYVAELTLYPGGGQTPYNPKDFNLRMGEMLKLPIETK